jgi:hypothetical protein
VQSSRGVHHEICGRLLVRPNDVFEIELEPDIAVLLAFADQGVNEALLCLSITSELMKHVLIEARVHDDRHYRHVLAFRRFQSKLVYSREA